MLADEVFVDILRFLDRYNIDAIEFSSLQLRDISLGHLQDDCFRRYEKVSVEGYQVGSTTLTIDAPAGRRWRSQGPREEAIQTFSGIMPRTVTDNLCINGLIDTDLCKALIQLTSSLVQPRIFRLTMFDTDVLVEGEGLVAKAILSLPSLQSLDCGYVASCDEGRRTYELNGVFIRMCMKKGVREFRFEEWHVDFDHTILLEFLSDEAADGEERKFSVNCISPPWNFLQQIVQLGRDDQLAKRFSLQMTNVDQRDLDTSGVVAATDTARKTTEYQDPSTGVCVQFVARDNAIAQYPEVIITRHKCPLS